MLDAERLMTMRGAVLLALRRYEQAIPLLEGAHRRNRSEPTAAAGLLQAQIALGRFDAAEKLLISLAQERALEKALSPMSQMLCLASGDRAMPRRIWEAVSAAKAPGADALAPALAEAARRLEDYAQARAILESAGKAHPGNAGAARMLADLFTHESKWAQALEALAAALAADQAGASLIDAGIADVVRGGAGADPSVRLRPAPAGFEKDFAARAGKDATPARAALCYVAGQLARVRGQGDLAREMFTQALSADKGFLPAYEALSGEFLAAKQYDRAEGLVASLRKADPAGYFVEYLAGRIAMDRGWVHSAIAPLTLAQQRNEKHRPTLVLLAKAFDQVGRHTDADAAAEKAIALDSSDAAFCQWYFDRSLANKQYRKAGLVAELITAQRPNEPDGPLMQAEAILRQGDTAQAEAILENLAARFAPTFRGRLLGVELRLGAPDWLLPKALYDQAVKDIRQALAKASPGEPVRRGQLLLARLLSRGGPSKEAVEAWSALPGGETLAPADARLQALSLIAAGKDEDAAKCLADMVLQDKGDDEVRTLLLEELLKLNRSDAAVRVAMSWQERAAKERDPKALMSLGRALTACRKAKQYDPAMKLLDRLMEDEDEEDKLAWFRASKVEFLHLAGRDPEALQAAEGYLTGATVRSGTALLVANALGEAQLFAGAHAVFDKAIAKALQAGGENAPAVGNLRTCQGILYRSAKDVPGGEAFCLAWVKASEPSRVLARQVLVEILLEAQQYDKAAALLTDWLTETATTAPAPQEDREAMMAGRPAFRAYCRQQLVLTLRRQGKVA
ncbi:MAG: tetratricopeptide repeat protein, partial [Planctomycetota bacterium]|nr:tetratricopeptide repeat protein [Planctomycetota bacterium]